MGTDGHQRKAIRKLSRFIDAKKTAMIAVTQNGQALQYVEERFQTEERTTFSWLS